MTLTLKQFHNKCKELTAQGYDVYIEGLGDTRWRLVVQDKVIRVGDNENE